MSQHLGPYEGGRRAPGRPAARETHPVQARAGALGDPDVPAMIFLPAAAGTQEALAQEAAAIVGAEANAVRGGVYVRGRGVDAMALNLHSRLAQRVLWPLVEGPYRDEQALYELACKVPWALWITPAQTLRVDVSAQASPLRSLNFAALRIKDAVCDALREASGERPSVDTHHPHLSLVLLLGPDHAALYVDTSGEALFKRGWRDAQGGRQDVKGEAPLKETLAAAMLAAAGWQGRPGDAPLLDPCCGAGTIAIEAAQMACGMAPGLQRSFAFERLAPFRPLAAMWQAQRQEARARIHAPAVPVFAGDVSFRMTDFAQRNAQRAGVAHAIEFKAGDALQRPAPAAGGVIVMNPPYGERIAPKGAVGAASEGLRARGGAGREAFATDSGEEAFFSALAAHWKRHYAGWTAWILSPQPRLPALMRLKESRRVPLWNGPIECRLLRFDMVAGSARPQPDGAAADTSVSQASAASGAVSARSTRAPRLTGT